MKFVICVSVITLGCSLSCKAILFDVNSATCTSFEDARSFALPASSIAVAAFLSDSEASNNSYARSDNKQRHKKLFPTRMHPFSSRQPKYTSPETPNKNHRYQPRML